LDNSIANQKKYLATVRFPDQLSLRKCARIIIKNPIVIIVSKLVNENSLLDSSKISSHNGSNLIYYQETHGAICNQSSSSHQGTL
jgi:hypothetical protein